MRGNPIPITNVHRLELQDHQSEHFAHLKLKVSTVKTCSWRFLKCVSSPESDPSIIIIILGNSSRHVYFKSSSWHFRKYFRETNE